MKKNGFTLAEVLITLAIIGVVATMTLPALMNNTGEQQYITGLKKGINTLTEAAQLSNALDGIDYTLIGTSETQSPSTDLTSHPSLYALVFNRINVDPAKTAQYRGTETPPAANGSAVSHDGNYAIFFKDGAAIYYNPEYSVNGGAADDKMGDGLPRGYSIVYDVNGLKGPNVLTNCSGKKTGNADAYSESKPICDNADDRVIGDQFGVRLRGNVAVPNGSAARWAFEK